MKNFTPMNSKKKAAFTLAEVLITLGVIGIVAAMTIPTLITKYQKRRTETQLLKFYSMINQTVRASSEDNGDPDSWFSGNHTNSYNENYQIVKNFIAPYMKNFGYEKCENSSTEICITLPDGGLMTFNIDINGGDIVYYTEARYYGNTKRDKSHKAFSFQVAKISGKGDGVTNSKNFVEPYTFTWDGTYEGLRTHARYGCRKDSPNLGFCTKMIQQNSWKIPDDYPW